MNFIKHFMSSEKLVEANYRQLIKITQHCHNPKIIFDIGANVGVFTYLFAKQWPEATIYAFEPIPENYNHLVENIKLNNLENIILYNLALWNESTTLEFSQPIHRDSENTGLYSAFYHQGKNQTSVKAVNLDSLNLPKPDFAKIDVEGSESLVLEGGRNTFSNLSCVYIERGKRIIPEFPTYDKVECLLEKFNLTRIEKGADEIWTH